MLFLRHITFVHTPNRAAAVDIRSTGLVAWSLGMTGCLLRYWTFYVLGDLFTFQLAIRTNHRLITAGPYSVVRHPSYTGAILASFGTGVYLLGPGSYIYECGVLSTRLGICGASIWIGWKAILSYNLVRRVKQEDAFLKAEFEKEWSDWANRVPYALFPGLL
ncbi:ICMT-domain-containing protein [Fomitopsis serialis]|uniref:ICMT-domain-containing protein n=1 Tax=Fomitopsis serialis TaxID=139415 RepID=UPI0020087B05|nr:ICMT-domain-containing protein [Neoantrodia serialis]KAH9918273.1 ICMT-domain-containing protein [Neoantrodia serialis]